MQSTSIIPTYWKIYLWSNLNLLSPNIACSRTDHSSQENQPPNLRGIESITAQRCVHCCLFKDKICKECPKRVQTNAVAIESL